MSFSPSSQRSTPSFPPPSRSNPPPLPFSHKTSQTLGLTLLPDAFSPSSPYFAHVLCELLCPPALHPPPAPLADRRQQTPTNTDDHSLELLGLKFVPRPTEGLIEAILDTATTQGGAARQVRQPSRFA
jgi:hypothetical protein